MIRGISFLIPNKYGSVLKGVLDNAFCDIFSEVCVADFRFNVK